MEKRREYDRNWYARASKNENLKKKKRLRTRRWNSENIERVVEAAAQYRARMKQAIPSWYEKEREQIQKLYLKANKMSQNTGICYSVDHIVPLTSDVVCGLHCLDNLRIITLSENSSKGNTF